MGDLSLTPELERLVTDQIRAQLIYDPFKEDVFSIGLIILQMMLMCGQKEIEEFRGCNELMTQVVLGKFMGPEFIRNITQGEERKGFDMPFVLRRSIPSSASS